MPQYSETVILAWRIVAAEAQAGTQVRSSRLICQ